MLTVIGCGNTNRCDDGVGPYVARRLAQAIAERGLEGVQSFDAGTGGMEVMFRARGSSRLIVVDACRGAGAPGALFAVPGEELRIEQDPGMNLHDFRWQHALYAGQRLYADDFPESVTVYLIEIESLDFGLELSARVQATADDLIERLLRSCSGETGDSRARIHCETALRMAMQADVDDSEKAAMLADVGTGLSQRARSGAELENAITLFRSALSLAAPESQQRARIAVQLGDALARLPDDSPASLHEAADLLEQALPQLQGEERAAAEMQLGLTLQSLASAGTADPRRALEHYQAALRVFTANAYPPEYAIIHNNMATLWLSLAATGNQRALHEAMAVQSFETALGCIGADGHPEEFAMLQNNLGNALQYAASGHPVANNLRALDAYDAALRIRERGGNPVQLANTLANRANCLLSLPDDAQQPERGNQQRMLAARRDAARARALFQQQGEHEKAGIMEELLRELEPRLQPGAVHA